MRFLLLAAFCSLLLSSCANSSLNKLYRQHKKQPDATKIKLPALLIRLGGLAATKMLPKESQKEGRKLRRKLGGMRFLKAPKQVDFDWDSMHEQLGSSGIEDLIFVRHENTRVQIAIREKRGKIRDLIILVEDDGELIYLHFRSHFKIKDLQKIIELIQQTDEGKKLPLPPMA